jgi:hypothetical protein
MPLLPSQYAALKAAILADPALAALPADNDGAFAIAEAFKADASPDFWVWRTSVAKNEYTQGASVDGTTFNWTGTGFITRSQGERDAWRELFNGSGIGGSSNAVNPSLPSVRQAFADIFSGPTAPAPANRTHMSTVSRRKANRAEKLFATGTGSTGSPATMTFEGSLTYQEVFSARNS